MLFCVYAVFLTKNTCMQSETMAAGVYQAANMQYFWVKNDAGFLLAAAMKTRKSETLLRMRNGRETNVLFLEMFTC
jgi:hypothetical protein